MRRSPRFRSTVLAAVLSALVLLALPGAALAVEPGLVGQWHLDATSGSGTSTTTPDASGYGNTGHFSAVPTLSAGRFGKGLDVASAGQPMTATRPAGSSWALESQRVSLTAWIKASSDPGTLRYIAAKGDFFKLDNGTSSCAGASYALYTGYPGRPGLSFYVTDGANASHITPQWNDAGLWDNKWHAVTGTYDGAKVHLYVDGKEVAVAAASSAGIRYATPAHDEFTIGTYPDHGQCGTSPFPGQIDEVRVHNRALSTAEIAKLQDKNATTPPDLTPPSPPPSGGGGGGGSTGGGSTAPPKPVAGLTVASTATRALGRTVLSAGATTNASRLLWDINNDGRTDFNLPASQPYLSLTLPSTRATTVKLTAVGAGGTDSFTRRINPGGAALSPSLFNQIQPPVVGASTINPFLFTDVGLGFSISCSDTTVVFSLVEASSCFDRIDDVTQVPGQERDVVQSHYSSEKVSAVVTSICTQAARGQLPQSTCDEARKFFPEKSLDVYVSDRTVKLNGLKITPAPGRHVVVYPSLQRVISSNAKVKWGEFTVRSGQIDLDLRNSTVKVTGKAKDPNYIPQGRANLLSFDPRASRGSVGSFKIDGNIDLALEGVGGVRSSTGTVKIRLPSPLTAPGGGQPVGSVPIHANNYGGPSFDNLDMYFDAADFGPVHLKNLHFRYAVNGGISADGDPNTSCGHKQWEATGNLYVGGLDGAGIELIPPPSQNGLGFCDGGFRHLGARRTFSGDSRPQIFPGVFLNYINAFVQTDPIAFRGDAGIDLNAFTKVDGSVLVAYATPWSPYQLTAGNAGQLHALAPRTLTGPTVAVGGTVHVAVPIFGDLGLTNGAAMYTFPDFAALAGSTEVRVPGMRIFGDVTGWSQPIEKRFQITGDGGACIADLPYACVRAQLNTGSRGMSACINIGGTRRPNGTYKGGINPGAGYRWGAGWPEIWFPDGCKPSHFWAVFSGHASADRLTFKVAKGETEKSLRIRGAGGAPRIKITAPGGEVLSLAGAKYAKTKTMVALAQDGGKVTWAGVKHGKPGTYVITRLPGSVAMGRLGASRPGYDTDFSARVTGRGAKRTLHYDARKKAGQKVTFVERGNGVTHVLKTVRGGRGSFVFKPKLAGAKSRRIVAVATLDGATIPDQTLAHYTVAGIVRTGRPKHVRLKRKGSSVIVRWTAARGAKAYGIKLKAGNAGSRSYTVGARRRSLTIKHVPLTYGGTVTVNARGVIGDWAKPRTATYKRRKAPFSAFQTKRHNEKLTAKREAAKAKAKARAKAKKGKRR